MSDKEKYYYDVVIPELNELIPKSTLNDMLSQKNCYLSPDFLGFLAEYYALSKIIPKHFTVIDFGCCMAAQCYFFRDHQKYIGVDCYDVEKEECPPKRFKTINTTHYCQTIQDFIKQETIKQDVNVDTTFAICNYVPDREARDLVRKTFPNCFVYYPYGGDM